MRIINWFFDRLAARVTAKLSERVLEAVRERVDELLPEAVEEAHCEYFKANQKEFNERIEQAAEDHIDSSDFSFEILDAVKTVLSDDDDFLSDAVAKVLRDSLRV